MRKEQTNEGEEPKTVDGEEIEDLHKHKFHSLDASRLLDLIVHLRLGLDEESPGRKISKI